MQHFPIFQKNSWTLDILILLVLISTFYFLFLGARPLLAPDEGRYAEIPREMIVNHDYITPRINTIKYFEKPPLYYWIEADAIKTFGLNEWSLRFPSALMGILGCLFIYATGRKLFDRRTGFFASLILATSLLYALLARIITIDMTLCTLLSGSLLAFLLGTRSPHGLQRRFLIWLAFGCAALTVMTKGLIGIVFPCMIVGIWMLCLRDFRYLRKHYLLSAIIIFLIIALPWHILIQLKHTEFFNYYIINQQFLRYFTKTAGRYKPFWTFIPILLLGLFPWTAFLFQALKNSIKHIQKKLTNHKEILFLIIWAFSIFIFFSFSKSKLPTYILPVFPPLALLIGHYLSNRIQNSSKDILIAFILSAIFAILLSIALILALIFYPVVHPKPLLFYILIYDAILLIGALCVLIAYHRKKLILAFGALVISSGLSLPPLSISIPYVMGESIKPIAKILIQQSKPTDKIVCYKHYYQDLPVYLNQTVLIADWQNELAFGIKHQKKANRVILNTKQLTKLWNSPKRVFMLARNKDYQEFKNTHPNSIFYLIKQTPIDSLAINRK